MGFKRYSNEEINEFCEVAKDEGIGKAIRLLGYPDSWGTAARWIKARGIEVPLDEIKQKAKAFHDWYETEDALIIAQEGMARISEALTSNTLSADEQKKLSEAYQKYVNSWLLLHNKATNINESRTKDSIDIGLQELLNEQRMKNQMIEAGEDVSLIEDSSE